MKNFKKMAAAIAATLVAATLTAPMAMNAFAAQNTITINGENQTENTTHKYTVYQIFSGTTEKSAFGGTERAELKEPRWATDAKASTILDALKAEDTFKNAEGNNIFASCTTDAASVAKALSGMNADQTKKFASMAVENAATWGLAVAVAETDTTPITLSADGYYVIAETTIDKKGTDPMSGTMTAYLLGVYDADTGAEITLKNSLPTFEKFIKDADDTAGTTSGWQKDADHDYGDHVPFRLEATLPEDYANYDTYKLIFHDALQDDVFTYDTDTAKIKLVPVGTAADAEGNGTAITPVTDTTCDVESTKGDDCDLEFTIDDVKTMFNTAKAGDKIVIEYTATLTTDAVLGSDGNWNGAYLEYSNNPNNGGTGTSRTTEDTVVAFTYQTVINKVDSEGNPLTGATFTLEKKVNGITENDGWVAIDQVETTPGSTFTFKGLDDGDYRLTETKEPSGYNKITDPIEFTVSATHGNKALTALKATIPTALRGNFTGLTADGSLTPDLAAGSLSGNIINTSGAELPSTGGMGTTLFYVGGGCMVAVAGIFLITKKRMNKKED